MQAMERRGLSRNRVSRLPSKGDMLTMSESPVSSHLALSTSGQEENCPRPQDTSSRRDINAEKRFTSQLSGSN